MIIDKIFTSPGKLFVSMTTFSYAFIGIAILVLKDFKDEYSINFTLSNSKSIVVRYLYYATMISIILLFGVFDGGQFIYFQF